MKKVALGSLVGATPFPPPHPPTPLRGPGMLTWGLVEVERRGEERREEDKEKGKR